MKTWLTKIGGAELKVMRLQEPPADDSILDNPVSIHSFLESRIPSSLRYNPDVENFMVILLNVRCRPIGWEVVSNGILDMLLVHAREVFKPAIVMSASAIVLAHNHPSGDPTPSAADVQVTKEMYKVGEILRIQVLDHIVIGQASLSRPHARAWCSLRELGYFYN